ncbi:MAG: hypothetical protein GX331_02525 [Firmicutes bacterium]|nr:hypothetical protein [Bacillota bacterium]
MMTGTEYLADLALGYIQDTLSTEEKLIVHQLIMESPEFLQILKNELELHKQMKSLKQPIPMNLERQVFINITTKQEQIGMKVLEVIFERTLPAMMQPVFKLFQRSVLAHE